MKHNEYNQAPHPTYPRPERLDKKNHRNDSLFNQICALSLMKSALDFNNTFKDENTITKLEEKENDNMLNEKSMDIFEALKYVKDHKDEYLVQKHNDRFTLHFDGKKHYTKFKTDSGKIVEGKVELDNAMNCSEWVKVEKKYLHRISGYAYINGSRNLIYSKEYYINSPKGDYNLNGCIHNALCDTFASIAERIEVLSEPIYDNKTLEIVTKIS